MAGKSDGGEPLTGEVIEPHTDARRRNLMPAWNLRAPTRGVSLKQARRQVKAQIASLAPDAAVKMRQLMESDDERVALAASIKIMELALASDDIGDAMAPIKVELLTDDERAELARCYERVVEIVDMIRARDPGELDGGR